MKENILIKAIECKDMKTRLRSLNEYFYNRKHETQIRDTILEYLNEEAKVVALSEYPKGRRGAACDLSIMCRGIPGEIIEIKHHYPKDLNHKADRKKIIEDIVGKDDKPQVSRFLLIVQVRNDENASAIVRGRLKCMTRNDETFNENYTSLKELQESFSTEGFRKVSKHKPIKIEIVTKNKLKSTFWFFLYSFK